MIDLGLPFNIDSGLAWFIVGLLVLMPGAVSLLKHTFGLLRFFLHGAFATKGHFVKNPSRSDKNDSTST